jgi:tetratricopeptide (TPR) repeat protein
MTSYLLALTLVVAYVGRSVQIDAERVDIINTGTYVYFGFTNFTDVGPQAGNILNAHYFPAMKYYEAGLYREANNDLSYFIERPTYVNGNPNQAKFMSTAHYARGMIYLHHATGFGRLSLAMSDFQAAIKWNEKNYVAYLELSRVFSTAGLNDQAVSILQGLLDLHPEDEKIAEEARGELATVTTKSSQPSDTPASQPGNSGDR